MARAYQQIAITAGVWQGVDMRILSLDLRERILASYDNDEGTRAETAHRFRVSLGMVKKLLQQRRRTGDIAPRHHFAGRKPMIVDGLAGEPGAVRTSSGR